MSSSLKRTAIPAIVMLACGSLMLAGCTEPESRQSRKSGSRAGETTGGEDLLKNSIEMLNRLDTYVDLDLRPPTVVLDYTTSRNRKEVLASLTDNPRHPTGRNDLIAVVTDNGQFARLKVHKGDRVRLWVNTDEMEDLLATDEDKGKAKEKFNKAWSKKGDRGQKGPVELTVDEVLNDNVLRVENGLPLPVYPTRMEIWRFSDDNIVDLVQELGAFVKSKKARIGWEPSPDKAALAQIVDRLNQWIRNTDANVDWQRDPVVDSLSETYAPYAAKKVLDTLVYDPYDARLVQEAIWARDISQWARGNSTSPVEMTAALFDWVVRNVQLETRESLGGVYHRPWQTLLFGRGTAEERAWVLVLLARQQGLNVVMLGLPDEQNPGQVTPWAPALWHEGKFYVFDARLGLPITNAAGKVATLDELAADETHLRKLDVAEGEAYPVSAPQLSKVVVLIEASPFNFARRAALLESRMVGKDGVALAVDAEAIAAEVKKSNLVGDVRLWELPYETIAAQLSMDRDQRQREANELMVFAWRPQLWKARVLHFKGEFDGENTAKIFYSRARPSEQRLQSADRTAIAELFPSSYELSRIAKSHASYWLGLVSFDDNQPDVAMDYFGTRTLEEDPDGRWTTGARYNLARVHEHLGQNEKALALYAPDDSPQNAGNQLRARALREKAKPAESAAAK